MTKTNTKERPATGSAPTSRPVKATANKPAAKPAALKTTKSDKLITLLSRTEGATIEAMIQATDWQSHSVRGFLAGALKKKLGRSVISEKTESGRIYKLPAGSVS